MIGIVGFNLFPQRNNVNWVFVAKLLRNKQRPECMKEYYEGHEDWYENETEAVKQRYEWLEETCRLEMKSFE